MATNIPTFLCLPDLIINIEDIIAITPRKDEADGFSRRSTARGSAIWVRSKEGPRYTEVSFEELVDQLKNLVTGKA